RNAKHFLPKSALPPYPEPKDHTSRVSGKCTMYLRSLLQGHGTSCCAAASGAPTECTQGTKRPAPPSTSYTALPMRVISFMFTTTSGESDNWTPTCAMWEPSGPIENGTTYTV